MLHRLTELLASTDLFLIECVEENQTTVNTDYLATQDIYGARICKIFG